MTDPVTHEPYNSANDPTNVHMVVVDEGSGYSVEDAYRVLANLPVVEPVQVQPEE